jgi:hypothetical protein
VRVVHGGCGSAEECWQRVPRVAPTFVKLTPADPGLMA